MNLNKEVVLVEEDIQNSHLTSDGLLNSAIRDGEAISYSDQAIWSGCYLAAESYRYLVEVREGSVADKAYSISKIKRLLDGIDLLFKVTGKSGLMARGIRPNINQPKTAMFELTHGNWDISDDEKYLWLGDVSIDQYIGVVFGFSVAFKIADSGISLDISSKMNEITSHLLDNSMQIIDIDGKRTKHGNLRSGFFNPLNSLLAYSILSFAVCTGKYIPCQTLDSYRIPMMRSISAFWDYLLKWVGKTNYSNSNLAFLAHGILKLSYSSYYSRNSLYNSWKMVKKDNVPLFNIIYGENVSDLLVRLSAMLGAKLDYTVSGYKKRFFKDRLGRDQASSPISFFNRPLDSFEWKENPYRLVKINPDSSSSYSKVDFLLAYWMARYYNFISKED